MPVKREGRMVEAQPDKLNLWLGRVCCWCSGDIFTSYGFGCVLSVGHIRTPCRSMYPQLAAQTCAIPFRKGPPLCNCGAITNAPALSTYPNFPSFVTPARPSAV